MYVSINRDDLVFVHKHPDHEVVKALSWMEIGIHKTTIHSAVDKARFLKTLTELELKMLYKNTTGGTLTSDDPVTLRYQLSSAVELLACTRAVKEEVLAQADLVDDRVHQGETFKYVYGARTPAQPQELFPLRGRPLSAEQLSNAEGWARSALPEMTNHMGPGPWPRERQPSDEQPAAAEQQTPETPPEPPAPVVKVKRVSATPIIRAAAEEAWKTAGMPTDEASLAELIKELRPVLVDERGMHKTTTRIQLAKWAKEKVA